MTSTSHTIAHQINVRLRALRIALNHMPLDTSIELMREIITLREKLGGKP